MAKRMDQSLNRRLPLVTLNKENIPLLEGIFNKDFENGFIGLRKCIEIGQDLVIRGLKLQGKI